MSGGVANATPRREKKSSQCIQHYINQVHRAELPFVASVSKFFNKAPVAGDVWDAGYISTCITLQHRCQNAIRWLVASQAVQFHHFEIVQGASLQIINFTWLY